MDNYTGKIQFFWCERFKYTCVAIPAENGGPALVDGYTLIGESDVISVDLKTESPADRIEKLKTKLKDLEDEGNTLRGKLEDQIQAVVDSEAVA
jgi:hypothetical protein